jgi:type II secretory pathway pseudopilin PulG
VDEQRELYGLPPSNLRGMATTSCIFQVIPYINGLIGYTIITPIFIGLMQSSVNQLADKSATTAPRATLPTQTTAPGMPGWAIALVVCGCLVPVMAIMAALLLPALVAAKNKAQVINSESNLKQIGLAFKIWADDNNDQFPFNVGQAQGGVKELCETDGNGFEKNPAAVFMVMSNELSTTRILVCPNDNTKQPAADFASLTANNISYQLRSGTNVNEGNPEEVLAVDPINGLVLHCDGSVELDLSYKKQDVNN